MITKQDIEKFSVEVTEMVYAVKTEADFRNAIAIVDEIGDIYFHACHKLKDMKEKVKNVF